jgi:hypothetical protein
MIGVVVNHPSENTLELFVLNAPSVAGQRREIEAHLNRCDGCRQLVTQMGMFYGHAERLEGNEGNMSIDQMLAKRPDALLRRYRQERQVFAVPERSRLVRISDFMRSHPYISGGGALFGLALLSIAVVVLTSSIRDKNPSFVHVNAQQGMIEVYNQKKEKLWQLPGTNLQQSEDPHFYQQSQRVGAVDLDGDGTREVLSCLQIASSVGQENDGFSILSADRTVRSFVRFERPIKYNGLDYPSKLSPLAFVAGHSANGESDIFVAALNSRSPMILARLNSRGEVIGEYWHFGHLPLVLITDIDGDGKEEIVLGGVDDTRDSNGGRFPVVVILDPERIEGITESGATRGFGKQIATAEKYHIRFPISDLEAAINAPGSVTGMERLVFNGEPALSFWVKQRLNGEIAVAFEYIFSHRLQILQVRSSGPSEILRGRLVKEGKLTGVIDSIYLRNLKRQLMYWDGFEWSRPRPPQVELRQTDR